MGEIRFLIIYFSGLVGGHLLALYIHRNHGDYRSAGASGAVCGVMFAAIALFPGFGIGLFILPFSLPGWLYGQGKIIIVFSPWICFAPVLILWPVFFLQLYLKFHSFVNHPVTFVQRALVLLCGVQILYQDAALLL
jgi:membrane associated rhomboid family serine protease